MAGKDKNSLGPDISQGLPVKDLQEDTPFGCHLGEDEIVLVKRGTTVHAVGAWCTHYHGPLAKGLVVGDTLRCPWHHACFELRSGAAHAPALNALPRWRTEIQDGTLFVREKLTPPAKPKPATTPSSVVIVGGGAAGEAAAETLRTAGYDGPVTLLSADTALPCDRPNLSKDYLAGTAPEAWIPLRGEKYFQTNKIDLRLNTQVVQLDTAGKQIQLADGSSLPYGALLLATGAAPVRLPLPGAAAPHVFYLRSLADSRAIIQAVEAGAKCAVVLGASFIGLEVAASLRTRGLEVHVVAPEAVPMARVMGEALGQFVRTLHASKGVIFHLQQTATAVTPAGITLQNGETLAADMIVIGVGVRPNLELAESAGLKLDRGVLVDEYLQTSAPDVYAAGDIARWPDPHSGQAIRVEHWAVAQRQGQAVARNMLGAQQRFTDVPFFWSQHYDATINYVGHAESWDRIETDGDPARYDFSARFIRNGKTLALASIYRDLDSLRFEAELERNAAQLGAT